MTRSVIRCLVIEYQGIVGMGVDAGEDTDSSMVKFFSFIVPIPCIISFMESSMIEQYDD